jgi:hypothetical protein
MDNGRGRRAFPRRKSDVFTPEECDAAERVLRGWYEKANDSPEWQEMWDRLREAINPPSRPIQEKLTKVMPLLQAMLSGN